jgi:hypothetical protein
MDHSAILIFNASRIPNASIAEGDINRWTLFVLHTLEVARKRGILKEKLTLIMDIAGIKLDKQLIQLIMQLVPIMQSHYPERLAKCFLFPTNYIFWASFKMSSYIIDPVTIKKIRLTDTAANVLYEAIPRNQYFIKYGGLAQDQFLTQSTQNISLFDKFGAITPPANKNQSVMKTSYIEEIYVAPLEYHNI